MTAGPFLRGRSGEAWQVQLSAAAEVMRRRAFDYPRWAQAMALRYGIAQVWRELDDDWAPYADKF